MDELRQSLTDEFSEPELQAVCASMGVDLVQLPGATHADRVTSLLDKLSASGQLDALENRVLRRQVDRLGAALVRERDLARSRDLASVAMNQLTVDPERTVLIALEASQIAPTYEARDALQQAMDASHVRLAFQKDEAGRIEHAYFASDHRRILTGGNDGWLRWWDSATGQELNAIQLCEGSITHITLSPARDLALITMQNDRTNQLERVIVDCVAGRPIAEITEDIDDDMVFFSHDGQRLISDFETDVSVWDARTGARLSRYMAVGRCLGISQDGMRALLFRYDGAAVILDLNTGSVVTALELPPEDERDAGDLTRGLSHFSPDGKRVTAGRNNLLVYVWNAHDGKLIHTLGQREPFHSVYASFTPSGQFIVAHGSEIWDANTGKRVSWLKGHFESRFPPRFLKRANDAQEYAIVGLAHWPGSWPPVNELSEWDIATGNVTRQFVFASSKSEVYAPNPAELFDLALDASEMLSLWQGVVRVYVRQESVEPYDFYRNNLVDREFGALLTDDREVRLFPRDENSELELKLVDRRTDQEIASLDKYTRWLFSPDGKHLVTSSHGSTAVTVRDSQTGQVRLTLSGDADHITAKKFLPIHDWIRAMGFLPDQDTLLVGSRDGTVRLWSVITGTEIGHIKLQAPDGVSYEAAISPDGSTIALVSMGLIHVWRVEEAEARTVTTTMYARGLRFSKDGSWLLALDENVAKIWIVDTLQPVGEFLNHFCLVASADISPDKTLVATRGADQRVRLWDPRTGKEIAQWRLPGPDQYNFEGKLRFSQDGRHLRMQGAPRMTVRLDDLMTLAESRLTRALTPEERKRFLDERMTTDQIGALMV